MILQQLADYLRDRRHSDPDFHIVGDGEILPGDLESGNENFSVRPSAVVEGDGTFFTRSISPEVAGSGFTHFLDGIQRTRLVGYDGIVPLVYGFTGAVIRERRPNRTMGVWSAAVLQEAIYAPEREIDADSMRERGIPVVDTSRALNAAEEACSARYRQAAISGIQRARAEAESQLSRQWVQEIGSHGDGWLFVDGSLTFAAQHARVAGIVKSHQTQYFAAPEQSKVLRLEVGERSALFLPGFGDAAGGDVYSWYLRLHPCSRRDLTYGLIRIEVDKRDEVIDEIDAISLWLMAERQPLTAPDPRWDKLLYPIRDCEEYLRSLAPSPTMMEAFLS